MEEVKEWLQSLEEGDEDALQLILQVLSNEDMQEINQDKEAN